MYVFLGSPKPEETQARPLTFLASFTPNPRSHQTGSFCGRARMMGAWEQTGAICKAVVSWATCLHLHASRIPMESEHRVSRASRSVPVREATMVTSLISSPSQLRPRRVGGLADPGYGLEPCLMLSAPHGSDSPCVGTLPVAQAGLWLVLLASLAAGAQAFYPRAAY